jgi:LmbE family N-acetylglucosaminyl deacetylase
MTTNQIKRAMAIMAHPDDTEFTCGGTFAHWIDDGWEITYVLCTLGQKGTHDPDTTPHEMAVIREKETRAAAQSLGVSKCVFLNHIDGELEVTMDFRRELSAVIRTYKPQVVFTHDPWLHYQIHPDHRAVGFSALDAIAAARDRLYFPEQLAQGLEPNRVKDVYLWAPERPNTWMDITDTFERKIAALRQHKSQVSHMTDLEDRLHRWAERNAENQSFRLAEAFHHMELS